MTQKSSVKPVRVAEGLLAGAGGSDPAVHVFKGVPFAAPPVGALRWKLDLTFLMAVPCIFLPCLLLAGAANT